MLKARGETWLDAPKYELDHVSRFAWAVPRPIRATSTGAIASSNTLATKSISTGYRVKAPFNSLVRASNSPSASTSA